ncbi:helix-turn-helix domain-containing protein [Amycolatopsis sp. H20-H5]|uniref:PucR family transcriptional regulator n=1 Tax=Amycolatopsis sp. H20-H5 TaxID=3046309 RepID=UPI002DBBD046|nr:helix-turn-helix domain-containing protein [Amycolatopsis sp. H20-H5]MEC3974373.1 helix-turn-helix domain-containing protein [Amycolatopsis sp. H20-H5]
MLWLSLPGEMARRLRPHANQLSKKILEAVQSGVPEYAKPLEGPFGKVITQVIEEAVVGSIDSIGGDKSVPQDKWAEFFRDVGRGVHNDGGSLDSLQASYRVGGQAAWRYVAAWGQHMHLSAHMLCVSAEAIFALIDEISSYSVEGYTVAQATATGTLERRRRQLLELLLATPQSSPQNIATMAKAANWEISEWVTVIALEPPEERYPDDVDPTPPTHPDVLVDFEGAQPCLVTANPDRDLETLAPVLRGWRAAVGPRVRLLDTATSLRWARRTMQLMQRGIITAGPMVSVTEHLSTVWLMHEDFLLDELTRKTLSRLLGLTPKQQDRLGETLLAWLECRGSTPEIAAILKIHPQTVRYRLNQLFEMFGDRLNDPSERLDIQLALRAHRLRGTRPLDIGAVAPNPEPQDSSELT